MVKKILYSIIVSIFSICPVLAKDQQNNPLSSNVILSTMKTLSPPIAKKIPHTTQIHGETLIDNYSWLRDKHWPKVSDPDILNYLHAENAYTVANFKPYEADFDKLYQELLGRVKLDDRSLPIKKGIYYYYQRTEKASNHPIYCRKKDSIEAKEEIILDANELATGSDYFQIESVEVSEDHQKLLYSADFTGSEHFTIKVKNLTNGEWLEDTIENSLGDVIWNKEGTGFFYAKLNGHWRSEEIYFHKLGDKQANDVLLYKEKDPVFWLSLDQSGNKRFLFIISSSKNADEVRYIDLYQEKLEPVLIQERQEDHHYHVDHHGDLFYIRTNDKGKNFRMVTTYVTHLEQCYWKELVPHHQNIYLSNFALYQNHLVLSTKEHGLCNIKVINLKSKKQEIINFPDPSYEAAQIFTTFDAEEVRISYSSLITPDSILEYNFSSQKLVTSKVLEIPSGYQKAQYHSERIFATSQDGKKIPISIFYKKSLFEKNGQNPVYLYGYGSYGISVPARFRHPILSLVDRGFVYAIAHIRGGDDMGYEWYESGKLLTKNNTFNDFINAADHLIKQKYTSPGNIVIAGGSAGGMLIGVCINERPELYKAAIADVPFVDVLNTMLDENLALTPGEFKEWGNPKDLKYYQYIKSYSPYDNIKPQSYPALYVTAGLNDPRVTYWEPAKWVAKLRELKTNDNLILLDTNMNAGHAGLSGRFGQFKDLAKEYEFILMTYGLLKPKSTNDHWLNSEK